MNILIASPEIAPLAKTGGLADVTGALPQYLQKLGISVSLAMPKYRQVQLQGEVLGEIEIEIGNSLILGHIEKTKLPGTNIPVYLICNEAYYAREWLYTSKGEDFTDNLERFTFFCKGILRMIKREWIKPDLIHANDWQTALLPIFIKTTYRRFDLLKKIKTLFTIHNLAYQGSFPSTLLPATGIGYEHFHMDELEFYNKINLLKGGIVFSDQINTVSETYAKEIQTEAFGCGLEGILTKHSDKLNGILNGVDYSAWNPESDKLIPFRYDVNTFKTGKAENKKALLEAFHLPPNSERNPLFGIVSRLAEQKGLDLVISILPDLIRMGGKLVILGTGDPAIENQLQTLSQKYPDSFGLKISYDNRLAHLIEAGADMFLMPSRYEPCGLNQMYSLRYGAIPVVRATGGLADTITDISESNQGTGFRFHEASATAFLKTIERAIQFYDDEEKWNQLISRAMQQDFTWDQSAQQYKKLYERILSL